GGVIWERLDDGSVVLTCGLVGLFFFFCSGGSVFCGCWESLWCRGAQVGCVEVVRLWLRPWVGCCFSSLRHEFVLRVKN
ncbi:hypothetical protein KC19_5G128300, partial [Ceratodon purpureus]